MARQGKIVCQFCETINPSNLETCRACGAPLARIQPAQEKKPASKPKPAPLPPAQKTASEMQEIRKVGEDVDELASKALHAYSLFWHILAEAFSIALVGFALGLTGGVTHFALGGVLGALVLGTVVGLTNKHPWLTFISAPLGILVGAGAGLILLLIGFGTWVFVMTCTIFAVLAAFLGGRKRMSFAERNWYEKARPFLGAAGGFVFGVLGLIVGLAMEWGVSNLLELV